MNASEGSFTIGARPVVADTIKAVLSRQLAEPESRLTPNGYDLRSLVEQLDAEPGEVQLRLRA